jgi:hypothetical protein
MKTNLILLAAVSITASFLTQAQAQYRVNEPDGIAASPKVRQMLNERKATWTTVSATNPRVVAQTPSEPGIAASPKVSQFLAEQKANQQAMKALATPVPFQPAETGIAASPRVQKEINERTTPSVQVAPLK